MNDRQKLKKPIAEGRRFSMFRSFVLADILTLGNAGCGTAAVFMCLNYLDEGLAAYRWTAFLLMPAALVLDVLDGFVARWRRRQSALGADLDSLADIISFGVAPAVIGYTLGMRGGWDVAVLVCFVACGLSRLARYNVTQESLADASGKVRYYEGLPIPTSLVLVGVLAAAFSVGDVNEGLWLGEISFLGVEWHPLSTMYLVTAGAMISSALKIPKP